MGNKIKHHIQSMMTSIIVEEEEECINSYSLVVKAESSMDTINSKSVFSRTVKRNSHCH